MTFEISFDDGATWTAVPIERDGDTADASVELPAEAAFGSVRFTAVDEAGNTVARDHPVVRHPLSDKRTGSLEQGLRIPALYPEAR